MERLTLALSGSPPGAYGLMEVDESPDINCREAPMMRTAAMSSITHSEGPSALPIFLPANAEEARLTRNFTEIYGVATINETRQRAAVLCCVFVAGVLRAGSAGAEHALYRSSGRELVLSVDALAAWYGSDDSWFGASAAFLGAEVDQWADYGVEPTLSFTSPAGRGALIAELSGVYASTVHDDAAGSTVGFDDTASLTLEQAHVGWRVDDVLAALDGDVLSVTAGRLDYGIGTGLLIDDGGADGGDRGGWYLGMRKAFSQSLLVSLDSETWLFELFSLKNQPREGDARGEARGANVEYRFAGAALGGSYLRADTDEPAAQGLDVFSARASWRATGGLGLAAEYADESSGQVDASGYYAEIGYSFETRAWSPEIRARRAHFSGDNPATPQDERFREIAYGSTDWTAWYQGEITGEYVLGNGNLESELLRLTLTPATNVTFDMMLYRFMLDRPAGFGATSDDWGDEVNFTVEWLAGGGVAVTGVLGVLRPGGAAEQIVGGGRNWRHAMLLVAYSW